MNKRNPTKNKVHEENILDEYQIINTHKSKIFMLAQ